ncbi:MFS transporter, partial [Vibrio vulnificus]
PFILGMDAYGIGAVFFGWGICLAITSVFLVPVLQRRFGTVNVVIATLIGLAIVLALMGLAAGHSVPLVVVMVVLSGALLGVNNTLYTELAMGVSDAPRPVAS